MTAKETFAFVNSHLKDENIWFSIISEDKERKS